MMEYENLRAKTKSLIVSALSELDFKNVKNCKTHLQSALECLNKL